MTEGAVGEDLLRGRWRGTRRRLNIRTVGADIVSLNNNAYVTLKLGHRFRSKNRQTDHCNNINYKLCSCVN